MRAAAVRSRAPRRAAFFFEAAAVEFHRVGEAGEEHVARVHLEVLGRLDRGDDVADAGDAQERQLVDQRLRDAFGGQELAAGRFVEEPHQGEALFVVDGDDHVGVAHVVNPGDVLVADAFDAMAAEAAAEQRGAFERFDGGDADVRMLRAEEVAGGDGAGRAGGGDEAGEAVAWGRRSGGRLSSIAWPVTW